MTVPDDGAFVHLGVGDVDNVSLPRPQALVQLLRMTFSKGHT